MRPPRARVVRACGKVDLDKVRGRTCRAVCELRGSCCVGANLARAAIGDLCSEQRDIAGRLGDCKRSVRCAVERLAQAKVSRHAPRLADRFACGEKVLERGRVFLRKTGSAGAERLGLSDRGAGLGP